jgi:Cu/Ag efflux pump CusA
VRHQLLQELIRLRKGGEMSRLCDKNQLFRRSIHFLAVPRTVTAMPLSLAAAILVLRAFGPCDAVLIMVNLPLALICGVAGVFPAGGVPEHRLDHRIHHAVGIAIRNGIMVVSHFSSI